MANVEYRVGSWRRRPAGAARRGAALACGLLVLSGCAEPMAHAAGTARPAPATITGITLERHCFGCPAGSTLVLRRDGSATYTLVGTERAGTADSSSTGRLRSGDFDALAQLIASQGFFEMADVYEDPEIRDGPWTTTRVTRGGRDKQVFRRDEAGPESLKAIESAIDALKSRIRFVPDGR